ncbi:Tc toxin subunit A [Pseudomonas lini]|uniref:Virulence plasmid 28 protein n=1 Tax=Pseudomonas lini TaxID=163011 RepID=A0A0J6HF17_9PSED|nr:Tc toxin subunit A [Pseudomonas lini]KAB0508429.1 virulence plasmid 28 protein [Pseudomonas lini]KMM92335.1 virulence plasmid 28 protein [Pseudomonas lini]SDS82871.1 virulence plasmid A protein [Pseudomonas lini]
MADSSDRDSSDHPALQLFQQVFKDEKHAELEAYFKEGGSIFPLVEKGVQALVSEYGVNDKDSRQFLRRANSLATYVRRQFIEHRLTGNRQHAAGPSSGLLSMVAGPSYERLFATPFDELCPPDALESCASPVAYLIELLRWIRDRIEPYGVAEQKYPLHDRRKDLKLLSVDFNAVHQAVSSVDIIVAVLEKFITEHGPKQDLEEALIQARYPNGLPYYQHWVSIDAVARHHGLSVGNFVHMIDLSSPYFLQTGAWDVDAGRALAHASRLGPYQRKLLTEPPAAIVDRDDFYLKNFGAEGLAWQNLNQVPFFGERTKLDTPGIEALLSVRGFAPVRSANVTYAGAAPVDPESERSGSVYLNANVAPAVSITSTGDGPSFLHRLSVSPTTAEGLARYDRMNRKVRLDNWLELPSDQVDALLVAAIRAEVRGGADEDAWWISDNVVHALGLFQSLRERYGCTAQDFAAFIDEMSVYGRGETLSQFDQVFNNRGDYSQPLKLDDQPFPVLPVEGATDLTVNQLCSGLGIDPQTYRYLALAIAQAHELGETLKRSPAVISSFYRLVKLPRLLGITPVEGVLMLNLLGGEDWLKGLAGLPQINTTPGGTPDVLNLIYALHSCVGWCRDRDLPVLWMLQQVSAPAPLSVASEPERQLFEQVRNLLPVALFTNAGLLMAGVPPLAAADWLDLLSALVDADGLVLPPPGSESDYVTFAREQLDRAVKDGLGDIDATLRAAIVEQMLGVLLQVREAQVSVVKECLAVYAGVDAEQAIRVLNWANATVHLLLRQVLERTGLTADESVRGRNEQPDPLLMLLADVRRRSAVVVKLGLSAVLLQDYLDYGHKAWLDQDDKHAFTVRTLYYLSTLTRAFELSEQPSQKLLDYLRQVNALPDVSGDALWLAQQAASIKLAEFFGWSVQEVRECVSRIDSSNLKVLKNLIQLDLLMRIRVLSAHSGMDALTIFLIGYLPEAVDKKAYADAAEHALLSLSEARAPVVQLPSDLKQLVQMTCTVDKTEVVANKPGEKITFTVTLKDAAGKPLSGVNVYWNATLGSIATKATWTDGTVKAEFFPGKVTGTDTPTFWLDFFEAEYAPTIRVLFESTSLTFPPPLKSPVPLGVVAQGDEVELYATLMDKYLNPGINSLVRWSVEPDEASKWASVVIRPEQTLTNQQGLTRVFVSSPTGGTFTLSVLSEGSETKALFEPITFGDVTSA